ncbi:MAG TPA: glycosyltransferase family 4 protein [Anaerolineales bacterium]
MRLLFLTNFYPPGGRGGYEQWCQETALGLLEAGHRVDVLTSRVDLPEAAQPDPAWVHRDLHMEMEFASFVHGLRFFTSREAREQENLASLQKMVSEVEPDLILVWGMWNLPRSLPALAEQLLPDKVVYYLADYWPTLPSQHEFYWQAPAQNWATRIPKGLLKPVAQRILNGEQPPALQFRRVIFPSAFLRDETLRLGVPVKESVVIYGGVDTRPFIEHGIHNPVGRLAPDHKGLSLLYAGRISPEKGVETAIQAMQELVCRRGVQNVRLEIVGDGERGYILRLRQMVQEAQLEGCITFSGPASKDEMPGLYHRFDAFLFPSIWQEPFGRVVVEALASGVVVIGTATGGAAEILEKGENALTFAPGDAAGLANQVVHLIEQPELRLRLIQNGQRVARKKFDISRMTAEIEAYLQSILG